jgi:hypothetical protein
LKGKRHLEGSVLTTAETIDLPEVLPGQPNPLLVRSFGKQIQKEKRQLEEASRQALLLRMSGPLYDNLDSPSEEDKLFGVVPEIDDSVRSWPEVAEFFSAREWDLFYSRFFERAQLPDSENNRASELIRRLKQHLRLCGNDPDKYPHLQEKLRFVDTRDVPVEPLAAERKVEIRELQKFALSLPEFSDGLTADEMQIAQTYVDNLWSLPLTAQQLNISPGTIKKTLGQMQTVAIKLQLQRERTGQPISEGLRVLGSRVYDDGFQTAIENAWAVESDLAERRGSSDDYQTQTRFQQDEGGPDPAFGGGYEIRRKS